MGDLIEVIKKNGEIITEVLALAGTGGAALGIVSAFGPPSVSRTEGAVATAAVMVLIWVVSYFCFRKYKASQRARIKWLIVAVSGCAIFGAAYIYLFINYTYPDGQGARHVKGYRWSEKVDKAMNAPIVPVPPDAIDVQDRLRPGMSETDMRKVVGDDEYDMYDPVTVDRMKTSLFWVWLAVVAAYAGAVGIVVGALKERVTTDRSKTSQSS